MPTSRILIRSHVLLLGLALSGCSGTTGSLLRALNAPELNLEQKNPQQTDTRASDDALRTALRKKAEHLVAERKTSAPMSKTGSPLSPNVAALLAQARQPTPAPMKAQALTPLPTSALSQNFHVKAQARLSDAPAPISLSSADASLIRFAAGQTQLDAAGNKVLAQLAAKSELSPRYTLVIVAGLNGSNPAWERMRMASERLDVVAMHVPPPLGVDRKIDPTLDGNVIRLELRTDQR